MEPITLISLFIAVVVVCGFGAVALRTRRQRDSENRDQELIERVVRVVGDAFDARLQVGSTQLEHRSELIDTKMESAQQRIGDQVKSMNSELGQLRQLVGELQKQKAQQHGELTQSLKDSIAQQKVLSETTGHLREVLANPYARGQWGERAAEDVLRAAGMQEHLSYRKQTQLECGTKPDFTFLLPHDQLLHMDVKFPAANYLRFLEADHDSVEASDLKEKFLKDVRQRIKEVVGRDYADEGTTLGYLLLFIPNESVYGFMHEHDPGLLDFAMQQGVVLCSPTTLFAILGVIRQAMDTYALERATDGILECLASFGGQWQKFSDQVDKVDKHLTTLTNSFGDLSGRRRRGLERELGKIDDLRSRAGVGDNVRVLESPSAPMLREVETN